MRAVTGTSRPPPTFKTGCHSETEKTSAASCIRTRIAPMPPTAYGLRRPKEDKVMIPLPDTHSRLLDVMRPVSPAVKKPGTAPTSPSIANRRHAFVTATPKAGFVCDTASPGSKYPVRPPAVNPANGVMNHSARAGPVEPSTAATTHNTRMGARIQSTNRARNVLANDDFVTSPAPSGNGELSSPLFASRISVSPRSGTLRYSAENCAQYP